MRIAKKIRLLVIGLGVLSSVGMAGTAYWGYKRIVNGLQVESLERQGESSEDRLSYAFSEISHDIQVLAGLPLIQLVLEGGGDIETGIPYQIDNKDYLANIFEQMLRSKPHYAQMRLIGLAEGGRETVRVDRINDRIVRVESADLQQKGDRAYYLEALKQPRGAIFYSEINLNREFGVVEQPYRPMFRVAMPIYNLAEQPIGVVVINLDFKSFANEFLPSNTGRYAYYLTNENGDYLVHPDPSRTFGFEFGQDFRAQLDHPSLLSFFDNELSEITFRSDDSDAFPAGLVHFLKLTPFANGQVLSLGLVATFEDVSQAASSIALQALFIAIVLLGAGFVLAIALSNRLTQPIEKIALAVEALGTGSSNVLLPTERDDELGALARSFQSMRATLQKHELDLLSANRELTEANRDLEHFAHIASHELREPIRRIDGLVNLIRLNTEEGKSHESGPLMSKLNAECRRAMQQITDFRVFAQISDNALQRRPVELNSVISELLIDFETTKARTAAVVVVDPLPTVSAYPSLVQMIYRNLIENAFKYATQPAFELRFTAEENGGPVVLGVRNTSSSISAEHHRSVFNLFTQLESNSEGTGTGLSICRRAVDRHAGKIWLESGKDFVHFKFTLSNHDTER